MTEWHPFGEFLHFKVVRIVRSDFLGSGYRYAKNRLGFVKRFLTREAAQKYADELNKQWAKQICPDHTGYLRFFVNCYINDDGHLWSTLHDSYEDADRYSYPDRIGGKAHPVYITRKCP